MPRLKKNDDQLNSPSQRLKALRNMARLTRDEIEAKHALSAATLKAWENGMAPITEKGIRRCIDIYRKEGVLLTRDWVLEGKGLPPQISVEIGRYFASMHDYPLHPLRPEQYNSAKETDTKPNYVVDDQVGMVREASYFKELYKDAVLMIVADEDMGPVYQPGDYIAGKFRYGADVAAVLGSDCIVRLSSGEDILRRVFKGQMKDRYNLACINPTPTAQAPILFDMEILAAAPVIWHRVPDR